MTRRHLSWMAIAALAACGGEGLTGGPAPFEGGGGAPTATSSTATGAGGDAPTTPKRTVMQRNPFGNVAATENLLWDGDFEFRPSFPEQYGWLVGRGFGFGFGLPDLALASECRSGIKCANLEPNAGLLGLMVGYEARDLEIRVWSKPASGSCDAIEVYLLSQDDSESTEVVPPAVTEPDDGWCRHEAVVSERQGGGYLYIANESDDDVVIDDCTILPVVRGQSGMQAASRDVGRDLSWIPRAARKATEPRVPLPSRGEKALRAHFRQLRKARWQR